MNKITLPIIALLVAGIVVLALPVDGALVGSDTTVLHVIVTSTSTPPSPPPATGGGGGGGGGSYTPPTQHQVIFRGKAYPGSLVTLMRDGQVLVQVPASPDANFEIRIDGVTAGTYTYAVWAEDSRKVKSIAKSFTVRITEGVTTVISGIFIPPTITLDKSEVRRGDPIVMIGQALPEAQVTIIVHSETEIIKTVTSGTDGLWSYQLDTLPLEYGDHTSQARAKKDDELSAFSNIVGFKVGTNNVLATQGLCIKADVNCDGKVNLVDFSILAYWFKRNAVPANVDQNNDARVNLVDFSIVAYYWTG